MKNDLSSRLAALNWLFRERAETDSEELDLIATNLERGDTGAAVRGEITRIAHRLAGAAGTFGFASISSYAAELEAFVADVPDSPHLSDACRALAKEIRRTTGEELVR